MSKMTIAECKDAAFRLLNQYSIAGTEVPLSYNDQSDDNERMLDLINDAQMEISKTNRPLEERMTLEVPVVDATVPMEEISFMMPEDFNFPISLTFVPAGGHVRITKEANKFKWIGDDELLLPNRPFGTYTLLYNRWPVRYTKETPEDTELDNTPDTHVLIPYYVAAMIAHDQNPKQYYYLYNRWETGLSRLNIRPAHATITIVDDAYGFDSFRGINY